MNNIEKKDIIYNLPNWNKNGHNILFITGPSGSGKSTLARYLAEGKKCKYIELDNIIKFYMKKNKNISDREDIIRLVESNCKEASLFFDRECYLVEDNWLRCESVVYDFISWFIDNFEGDGNNYIIEGAQIALICNPLLFKERPIIIKNYNNTIKYKLRKLKRNYRRYRNPLKLIRKVFKTLIMDATYTKWYKKSIKSFNNNIKALK